MTMIGRRIAAAAAGLAALVFASGAMAFASGGNSNIVVVNDNVRPMVQFYVGRQQVLSQPLYPGQSFQVNADEGRGCRVRLTAVFDDGTSASSEVNACLLAQYPATARGIPFCPGDPRCKRAERD